MLPSNDQELWAENRREIKDGDVETWFTFYDGKYVAIWQFYLKFLGPLSLSPTVAVPKNKKHFCFTSW